MFLTVQFQNRKMKVVSMRLPPLPHKKSFRKLRIDSQKAAFSLKCDIAKNNEGVQTSTEEIPQPVRYCDKTIALKRPVSKESVVSINSNRIRDSHSSINTKKNTSIQLQKLSHIPPKVTAKSWVLYEIKQGRCLYNRRPRKQREMASLTKMMNLVTILELMQKNMLFGKKIKIKATRLACSIEGTTAQLKVGCQYNLSDLLYGMMLPSGNDAAFLISQVGGYIIQNGCPQSWAIMNNELETRQGTYVTFFLREMNLISHKIGMQGSNFANPHGLNNPQNYSCAQDLAKLCCYAMKNKHFRKIVQTRKFQYSYFFPQDYPVEDDSRRDIPAWIQEGQWRGVWENTNRMLGVGWSGIKTGITPNAGPCLAASRTKILNGREYEFLVILLGSQSMEARWNEVSNLVDWAINTKLYL